MFEIMILTVIFIYAFHSEISEYIKACAEAKRNQDKRFDIIVKAVEEWNKKHDNAD